ncbi:unnamed protein product [Caenorhabditis auriculariae]|uniref:Protein transport protein sec16 n=1 Tax=Caenorhabditis auriculariae TaxID=2777116 RepID=A0A8S1H4Z6_9PELO|nr:unnamed protein product [Caenorhabditis auriculariae]
MSLYWEQQQSAAEQPNGAAQNQQSQWDYIHLGSHNNPQYQWNQQPQQHQYQLSAPYQQNPAQSQQFGYQQYQGQNTSHGYAHPQHYDANACHNQQQPQHQYVNPHTNIAHGQVHVQHTPILNAPKAQNETSQTFETTTAVATQEQTSTFVHSQVEPQSVSVSKSDSSEDDWEKPSDFVKVEMKEEPNSFVMPDDKASQESRESSLGGSWSQNEGSEERNPLEQNEEQYQNDNRSGWEQNQGVVPVAKTSKPMQLKKATNIVKAQPTTAASSEPSQAPIVHIDFENLTVSAAENTASPGIKRVVSTETFDRLEMGTNLEKKAGDFHKTQEKLEATPEKNIFENFDIINPGEAQATSTPIRDSQMIAAVAGVEKVAENPKLSPNKNRQSSISSSVQQEDNSEDNSDSSSRVPQVERGSIRASYRNYKQQYKDIVNRLNGYRVDVNRQEFRPSSKLANPLVAAAHLGMSQGPVRSETAHNLSIPSNMSDSMGRRSVPLPPNRYSEDLMNMNRRQRQSRLDSQRPSSRTQISAYTAVSEEYPSAPVDPRLQYGQYPPQRYHQGRYSAIGAPYRTEYYDQRRPQSTYAMMQGTEFGGYPQEPNDGSSSMSASDEEVEDEQGESEDELRRYNSQNRSQMLPPGYPQAPQPGDGGEMYYFGVVHLDMEIVSRIMKNIPPPQGYFLLPAIEKAAFLFYAAVYKNQYRNVDEFHKRFNREFYKYVCAGDSNDTALWKICKSMQDQYHSRQLEKSQKAYEASQKHLFSDDHESIDAQSDAASNYDKDDTSIQSFETQNKGPMKFSCPHTLMSFGVGGKTVTVCPDQSVSVVFLDDLRNMLGDISSLRIVDTAQHFKGPLIPGQTPTHSVRLYIQRQIEFIRSTDVARENPLDNDVVDSLLVWQLLEMMVQQHGRVTGPDVARLLSNAISTSLSVVQENAPPPIQPENLKRSLERFTEFLLGGHIDEAIESAVRDGLYSDAMVLVRRLFPNNQKKIAAIEERFLLTRSMDNPVTTLVSVASELPPPILTNPPLDDHMSWRMHAAIVLANLNTPTAMNTVYHLGRALAKRDYHCAADFCLLAVCVLAGYDPFQPVKGVEGEEDVRRHISLLHSGIPDDCVDVICPYGFAIPDLHATEIFDYALRLAQTDSPLSRSVEYQTSRIKYAKLLAGYGGFATDAFRYCLEIARAIWPFYQSFEKADLLDLCNVAERLQYVASADQSETNWIESLRTMIFQAPVAQTKTEESVQTAPTASNDQYHAEVQQQGLVQQNLQEFETAPAPVVEGLYSSFKRDSLQTSESVNHPMENFATGESLQSSVDPFSQPEQALETPAQPHFEEPVAAWAPDPVNTQNAQISQFDLHHPQQQHHDVPTMTVPPVQAQQFSPIAHAPPAPASQAQQQLPAQSQPQAQSSSNQKKPADNNPELKNSPSRGWLGSIREKVTKAIPKPNSMYLPDDNKPQIIWDPVQKRYIGEGVEEEVAAPPPPTMQTLPSGPPASSGGLRSARTTGASRYFQAGQSNDAAAKAPAAMAPPMPLPTSFGFMPAPSDDSEYVDPFSGEANPSIPLDSTPNEPR